MFWTSLVREYIKVNTELLINNLNPKFPIHQMRLKEENKSTIFIWIKVQVRLIQICFVFKFQHAFPQYKKKICEDAASKLTDVKLSRQFDLLPNHGNTN